MKKYLYTHFFILLCITSASSYIGAYIIEKEKNEKNKKMLIHKITQLYSTISLSLIQNINSSNKKINNSIKTTLNSYLKKEKNFSFYHISSLKNGMFIPFIIGKKQNSNMIMINLNNINNSNTNTSILYKGNFIIFYKKLYFKNNPIFILSAFNKPSYTNIYIYLISINIILLSLTFSLLKYINNSKKNKPLPLKVHPQKQKQEKQ